MPDGERAVRPIALRVVPGPLAQPVGARVVTALAARADLPLDRVLDALLLTDTVLGSVLAAIGTDALDVTFAPSPGRLAIALVGLPAGTGERLLNVGPAVQGISVLARLCDETRVTVAADGSEHLDLVVLAARPDAAAPAT